MVLAGERTPIILIEDGVRINQHVYLIMLNDQLVPWVNATFQECGITLQQDGATSNTANLVQERCNKKMTGFLDKGVMASFKGFKSDRLCCLEYHQSVM